MRRLTVDRRGERYVLSNEEVTLEVDPAAGGRVASFRLGDVEILAGPEIHPTNWGSTLWTSPQSDWGWPPPAEFDDLPYAASLDDDGLSLVGPTNAFGIALSKTLRLDAESGVLTVRYAATNSGDVPRSLALWEVSRVPPRGLTFFPSGAGTAGTLPLRRVGPGTWYEHDPSVLTDSGSKSYGDGTGGFIAHAHAGILFVKTFDDLGPELQAPGEGEVEVYGNNRYVEVEVQGPYLALRPGESTVFSVRWLLRPIPTGVTLALGSADLLEFAERVASR
jgi:hypothetical protein